MGVDEARQQRAATKVDLLGSEATGPAANLVVSSDGGDLSADDEDGLGRGHGVVARDDWSAEEEC
ncbi:MAG: hypothetical protein JO330_05955 [Mycobacteriaceae bacterium]|nr:hypothetical protein [Mycobacteriaceae bacterium]